MIRCVQLCTALLGFSVIIAGFGFRTTASTNNSVQQTVTALQTESAGLLATASSLQTQSAGIIVASPAIGASPLSFRPPTAEEASDLKLNASATPIDCKEALQLHDAKHRWAFVGICEGGIDSGVRTSLCSEGQLAYGGPYQTLIGSGVTKESPRSERKAAYDAMAHLDTVRYSVIQDAYNQRLSEERKAGDVPLGVPESAPDLLTVLERIKCQLPV